MNFKKVFITGGSGLLGSEFIKTLSCDYFVFNLDLPRYDVTDKPTLKQAFLDYGIPYGVINCAAIDFPPNSQNQDFERVMKVNVEGVKNCCEIFGAEMERQGEGNIINIASIYGMVSPDQRIYTDFIKPVSYGASKAAVINMTKYYATLYKNVRVNCLSFGGVYNNQDEEFVKKYCERVPMGRMARRDEYNGLVKFMLSDGASYITGANIVADGGYTAW